MAELLVAYGWPAPDSAAEYLHEALPREYLVVVEPIVQGQELDAVVVGPQGLFVLHLDGPGDRNGVARNGSTYEIPDGGRELTHPARPEKARKATRALRAFLKDEFPGLDPAIHHFRIESEPDRAAIELDATELPVMTRETVVDAIISAELPPEGEPLDAEARERLAVALRDRQLTASQRASRPFIFRSGGKKAWTIRELVAQMDRDPADGIYHLRNGSLARWLSEQGAEHLAELAREVVGTREVDPRLPLEAFLIGTGLVARPRLASRPPRLGFGPIVAGQSAARRWRVRKGGGRGYLFGTVRTSDPWLHVEPENFTNGELDAIVTVHTESLLISPAPYQAELLVESSASVEPIAVPVQFRVVGMPSGLIRIFFRPLAGALAGALPGAVLGGLLGPALTGAAAGTGSRLTGALAVGLVWALFGALRGFFQPPAWSIAGALRRWLVRMAVWVAVLAVLGAVVVQLAGPLPGIRPGPAGVLAAALLAAALAVIPATLGEIEAARNAKEPATIPERRRRIRPATLLVGAVLVLILAGGLGLFGTIAEEMKAGTHAASVQVWATTQSSRLEQGLNDFIDRLYLRRYDRRAPAKPTPTLPAR